LLSKSVSRGLAARKGSGLARLVVQLRDKKRVRVRWYGTARDDTRPHVYGRSVDDRWARRHDREIVIQRLPQAAQGHFSNGLPAGPWDLPVDMAGAGGVRATLPDMVRYLEGHLGTRESSIAPVLARTQQEIARISGIAMGTNWVLLSTASIANGRTIIMHAGGTGGSSSFIAFDRAAKRAVVLLSDTELNSVGGLNGLGLHLLDPSEPAGAPRIAATADTKLVDALIGRYRLQILQIGLGASPSGARSVSGSSGWRRSCVARFGLHVRSNDRNRRTRTLRHTRALVQRAQIGLAPNEPRSNRLGNSPSVAKRASNFVAVLVRSRHRSSWLCLLNDPAPC
jgi:CubicO group peptidase (beta-lactamase class C family)